MSNLFSKIWETVSQPLLPAEAQIWVYLVTFVAFVTFPIWIVAYGKFVNRKRRGQINR